MTRSAGKMWKRARKYDKLATGASVGGEGR